MQTPNSQRPAPSSQLQAASQSGAFNSRVLAALISTRNYSKIWMQKKLPNPGFFNPRILIAFTLCVVVVLLAMLSFGATSSQQSTENSLPLTDRVSAAKDGADASGPSFFPAISA